MHTFHTDPLLTTRQAAALLGYSHGTLRAWRHLGKGPAYIRVNPSVVRYRQSAIREWIDSLDAPRP